MSYAPVDGAELWYEDTGGSGQPVIFVHGMVGNGESWVFQRPAFEAPGLRVITFDLRGHGRSRPEPGREGEGSIAADIEALAQYLGLASIVLVGQAYGAFGVLEYAIEKPARLKAAVIACTMAGLGSAVQRVSPSLPPEERELGPTYRARDPEGVRRFLEIESHNQPRANRQRLREAMTLERLEQIKAPSIVIAADEDGYASPAMMKTVADHIPDCGFEVIEGSGHCAYWEQPERWNQIVLDFLKRTVNSD